MGDYTHLGKRIYRNEGVTWNLVDHDHIVEVGGGAGKKCPSFYRQSFARRAFETAHDDMWFPSYETLKDVGVLRP